MKIHKKMRKKLMMSQSLICKRTKNKQLKVMTKKILQKKVKISLLILKKQVMEMLVTKLVVRKEPIPRRNQTVKKEQMRKVLVM